MLGIVVIVAMSVFLAQVVIKSSRTCVIVVVIVSSRTKMDVDVVDVTSLLEPDVVEEDRRRFVVGARRG